MIIVSIILMVRHKIKPFKIFDKEYRKTYVDSEGKTYHYSVPPLFAFVATLFIGILTGLFGIGGGVNDTTNVNCFQISTTRCSWYKHDDDFLFKCYEFYRSFYKDMLHGHIL